MTERMRQLFLLLRAHLLGFDIKGTFPELTEPEWSELYGLSLSHGVHNLAFEGIVAAGLTVPEGLRSRWMKRVLEDVLKYYGIAGEFIRITDAMKEEGLNPVILKGFSVSRMYPKPELRVMGDIDILVHERFYAAALCLEGLGYKARKEVAVHHIEFAHGKYLVELHRTPFTPIGFKGYDRLVNAVNFTGAEFRNVSIDGMPIPILTEKSFIDESFEHILKHLIHDRITLRNLCDILMLFADIQKDLNVTDWSAYYGLMDACGMGHLFSGLTSVLVNGFGLPPEAACGIPLMDDGEAAAFADEILSVADIRAGTNRYYEKLGFFGAARMLTRYLGAVRRDVKIKYPYCRKSVFLRPVALVHAYWDYFYDLFKKLLGRGG
jgi:hypothetical protein